MKKKILAAGILAIDKNTGEILLVRRSFLCPEPNTWANVGGKMDLEDDNPRVTAIREFKEEVQPDSKFSLSKMPFFINENNFIKFYTYLGLFDNKFVPILNEENIDYGWFNINNLPENMLPGCKLLFDERGADLKKLINNYLKKKKGQE